MRGGARANSGRPPDPDAIRNERSGVAGWTTLPDRREGPAPEWPLTDASQRELHLWAAEWARPQAVMWERAGLQVEVAMYVRTLRAAEKEDAAVAVRTLLKQQQEALGLSLPGLARNRWRIGSAEPTKEATKTNARRRTSASARFEVIQGKAAG